MKSFFTYSRLVFESSGGLEGAKGSIIDASRTTGEVVGGALETVSNFWKRMEVVKTSKDALRALRDGFNKEAHPLKSYPSSVEKNKKLIDFVALQLGYSPREIKDALYEEHTSAGAPALRNKRHEIIQKMIILQSVLPEMELTFVGATKHEGINPGENMEKYEARVLNSHDAAWYLQKKSTFTDMLEVQIGPSDIALYMNTYLNEIREYIDSENPQEVAAKYPRLFLSSKTLDGQPGKYEINGHNLLDLAKAYENARLNTNLLHKFPAVRNSSLEIPGPTRFDLYVFDTPQDRLHGATMKYRKIGEGQVGASGISEEPTLPEVAGGAASAGGGGGAEKAPDGKEGERLDPMNDLNTYATKTVTHKWKGIKTDTDADGKRYDLTDLTEYVPRIEKVLQNIDTDEKYKEFWPLLKEIEITVTPNDVRDINIFSEGFSWDDGKLKIDYNESEDSIRADIIDGLRAFYAYKKLGSAEKPEVKKDRLELARQTKMYIDNWELLFPKDDANKNAWINNLEVANDPQAFAKRLETEPRYAENRLGTIRESVRKAYIYKLTSYIDAWDAKIGGLGAGADIKQVLESTLKAFNIHMPPSVVKDSGGRSKQDWEGALKALNLDAPPSVEARNIDIVVPWVHYFDANLSGNRLYPAPIIPPVPGGNGEKEKTPEVAAARKAAEDALKPISLKSGYPLSLLPLHIQAQEYTYDYKNITANASAIDAALLDLNTTESDERKTILKNIGLSPTPERSLSYKVRRTGYQELPDGKKRILFKVTDNPGEMAAAISEGITEAQEANADAGKEKTPESMEVVKKNIKGKIKDWAAWKAQTADARESEDFAGTGLSLVKIAKIFKIDGDPSKEDYPYKALGDAIYGPDKSLETAKDPESKAKRMLLEMSNTLGFNVELQSGITYDYDEILTCKDKFNTAFNGVNPSTKKVLAKCGVVLGEHGSMNDQEGVIKTKEGKYRIAIDWNEDADEITKALNEYANDYEEEVKDMGEDDVDDMSDLDIKETANKRLQIIKGKYKLKGIDYESGFDDHKDLVNRMPEVEKAFATLSDADKEKLEKGGFQIKISNGAMTEGWISDHTILIDYDETADDIQKDLSQGIEKQESKESIWGKIKASPGKLLGYLWDKITS